MSTEGGWNEEARARARWSEAAATVGALLSSVAAVVEADTLLSHGVQRLLVFVPAVVTAATAAASVSFLRHRARTPYALAVWELQEFARESVLDLGNAAPSNRSAT